MPVTKKTKKAPKKVAKKVEAAAQEAPQVPLVTENEFRVELITLGHFFKYNIYLLAKSVIFASLVDSFESTEEAVEAANQVIQELDLDSKERAKLAAEAAAKQTAEAK